MNEHETKVPPTIHRHEHQHTGLVEHKQDWSRRQSLVHICACIEARHQYAGTAADTVRRAVEILKLIEREEGQQL